MNTEKMNSIRFFFGSLLVFSGITAGVLTIFTESTTGNFIVNIAGLKLKTQNVSLAITSIFIIFGGRMKNQAISDQKILENFTKKSASTSKIDEAYSKDHLRSSDQHKKHMGTDDNVAFSLGRQVPPTTRDKPDMSASKSARNVGFIEKTTMFTTYLSVGIIKFFWRYSWATIGIPALLYAFAKIVLNNS